MKKKLLIIWSTLLIAMLTFSPVYAGGVSITWGGGSIIGEGYAYGFSRDEVTITLDAVGNAYFSCVDPGNANNVVPGQNPITVKEEQEATVDLEADENGKFSIKLEADVDPGLFTPKQVGCPNNNWKVVVDWVDWTWAAITVTDNSSGKVLWYQEYECMSSPSDVDCSKIKVTGKKK